MRFKRHRRANHNTAAKVAAPQPNRICESGELGVTQNGGIFRRETRRGNMRYSIAAALLIALATGSAMAQPVPVPQFGLPTPSVFSSKIGFFTPDRIEGASYPRVIQLRVGANKGALLATFGRRGSLPIFRSTDNGDNWQQFSEVPQLTGQPCLYELPVKMGEFPAGTVMARGTGVGGPPGGKHTLDV